jgi:hypothetical protein
MEEDLKQLQVQFTNDVGCTQSILSATKDLVSYLNLEPKFFRELELTSSTLEELLRRTSKALDPEQLKPFLTAIKQVRIMAGDLLDKCKANMYSA